MAVKEKKDKNQDFMADLEKVDGKKQRRPIFKKKRGGVVLSREQVKAIKLGRKKLRKELKARGVKDKKEFEVTASSLGLYFDKNRFLALLRWLTHGRGLWALLGALLALLTAVFAYSAVTQLQGHFTINMSDGMFKEGFVLSETEDFANPTTHLFCTPAEEVPCISISHIPKDIDSYEGQHNENYFAYTFFLRNEGESTVGYDWSIGLNSESKNLSEAAWVMIFEDGVMKFYAKPSAYGGAEALPYFHDQSRGYIEAPLIEFNANPDHQYSAIAQRGSLTYWRVIPEYFVSDNIAAQGSQSGVAPMDVHKYTIVIWLEGDDPDCTDEMIGGHVGMEMYMKLESEESDVSTGQQSWEGHWDSLWDSLKFWKG